MSFSEALQEQPKKIRRVISLAHKFLMRVRE